MIVAGERCVESQHKEGQPAEGECEEDDADCQCRLPFRPRVGMDACWEKHVSNNYFKFSGKYFTFYNFKKRSSLSFTEKNIPLRRYDSQEEIT
jgi:hypothetical protein